MPDPSESSRPSTEHSGVPLKEIATDKVGALNPKDTVSTAGARMREHETDAWPVAEDSKLVGMVQEENPDWNMGGHGHDPKSWRVGQIMKRDLLFCYEDEDCRTAQKLMDERGLRYLPVVDRQMRIVGIFNRDEIGARAADGGTETKQP